MQRFHYLGDCALVGESLRYAAFLDSELVALVGWGSASLNNPHRDRHIGWDIATKQDNLHQVVNNVRFLIVPWIKERHLASRVLGANLRRLGRDWQSNYGHRVLLAETFVDTSRFAGTCYRASNWRYLGQTQGWSKSGSTYRFHGQPKSVWVYPLHRNFKRLLCTPNNVPTQGEESFVLDIEKLPLCGKGGLFEVLSSIVDPRKRRGVRHQVQSIVAITVCATLAGSKSFVAIAQWASEQSSETLKRLGSKRGKPPSERTFRRVLQSIDVEEVDRKTGPWVMQQQVSLAGKGLAVDGKTLRGSRDGDKKAVHLLSAVVHESGTVVAQVPVDRKTNEITCARPLLAELDIKDSVVTADALLAQKAIARYVVEDKEADYLFTVKDNQPTLKRNIESLGLEAFPPSARNRG